MKAELPEPEDRILDPARCMCAEGLRPASQPMSSPRWRMHGTTCPAKARVLLSNVPRSSSVMIPNGPLTPQMISLYRESSFLQKAVGCKARVFQAKFWMPKKCSAVVPSQAHTATALKHEEIDFPSRPPAPELRWYHDLASSGCEAAATLDRRQQGRLQDLPVSKQVRTSSGHDSMIPIQADVLEASLESRVHEFRNHHLSTFKVNFAFAAGHKNLLVGSMQCVQTGDRRLCLLDLTKPLSPR